MNYWIYFTNLVTDIKDNVFLISFFDQGDKNKRGKKERKKWQREKESE